jgi:hypothetical protein
MCLYEIKSLLGPLTPWVCRSGSGSNAISSRVQIIATRGRNNDNPPPPYRGTSLISFDNSLRRQFQPQKRNACICDVITFAKVKALQLRQ